MTRKSSTHFSARPFALAALLGMPLLAAACEGAESKRMKALAGNYVSLYESETAPGQQVPMVVEQSSFTFRPDGRWTSTHSTAVNGVEGAPEADSGAYRIEGTTLTLQATAARPSGQFTISGDTLWALTSQRQQAVAEAVTGIKVDDPDEQGFFVRQRDER